MQLRPPDQAAVCMGSASLGISIVTVACNEDKAALALATLHGLEVQTSFVAAGVTKKADCQALLAAIVEKHGRVDILMHKVGPWFRQTIELLRLGLCGAIGARSRTA